MKYQDTDRIIARNFGVKAKVLHSHSQVDHILLARAAAIKINHDLLKYSFNRLCRLYDRKSHNTAGNAYRNACNMYDTDKRFRAMYDQAHQEAIKFSQNWIPRKQRYNLHYRLREKEIRLETKSRVVSITADQETLISGSRQLKKLLKTHNYSVQYAIL
jgi:hypothetical protein